MALATPRLSRIRERGRCHTERYVIAAKLKGGEAAEAERMLAAGPPFDPAQPGLSGHSAYLGDDRVYRVFGGEASRKKALNLAREHMVEVSRWQSIIDGLPSSVADVPSDARCLYRWTPEASSEA